MYQSRRNEIQAQAEKDIRLVREQINAIDVQMRELKDKRERLVSERDRIKRLTTEPPTGRPKLEDDLGVSCKDLAPYIIEWIEEYDDVNGSGGQKTLALFSGTGAKHLRRIMRCEQTWVSLRVADMLMTAILRQQALSSLPVYQRPHGNGQEHHKPLIPERPISVYSDT